MPAKSEPMARGKDRPVSILSWPCRTFQSIGFTAATLTVTAT